VDNNKPNPIPSPTPNVAPDQPPQSSSKMVWLIGGLVIILIIVAGVYLFAQRQKSQNNSASVPQATLKPVVSENLDQELNAIDVQASDSDFTSIDQDLKTL